MKSLNYHIHDQGLYMPVAGIALKRQIRQRRRKLMTEIAIGGNIKVAARGYTEALGAFRAEMFSAIKLDVQMKGAATEAMHRNGHAA